MKTILQCPDLEVDTRVTLSKENRYERRVIWNLLNILEEAGWRIVEVDDSDYTHQVATVLHAMNTIFAFDHVDLTFEKDDMQHLVRVYLGEGEDLINDFTYSEGDADGFQALMKDFDPVVYG